MGSGRNATFLLRVASVTVVGSGVAYYFPTRHWDNLIQRRADKSPTLESTIKCLPRTVRNALLYDKDIDPRATGELVFISCADRPLLRVLRETARGRQGLTAYRLSLEGGSSGTEHGLEIQVLKPDRGGIWDLFPSLPWWLAADAQDRGEIQHVSSLSSIDTGLDGAQGGDGPVGPPPECQVIVHLPPLPGLYGLSAAQGGAAAAQHKYLTELVAWLEQRQHSVSGLTVTSPSPSALQWLAEALLRQDITNKAARDEEQQAGASEGAGEGQGVQELVLQAVGLVDRGVVFVHVEGASKELVDWLQHTPPTAKAAEAHVTDTPAAVADSDMELMEVARTSTSHAVEEEQEEKEAAAEETGAAVGKGPSMSLWWTLLGEGAFGRAEELERLLEHGQGEEKAEEVLIQREKERLIAALDLHDALAHTGESDGVEPTSSAVSAAGVGPSLPDPISGYDALCAVLSDKLDVLTGMPVLPTGVALLDDIRAACLDDDGLVHSLIDHQLLHVTTPSSALAPVSDDTHLLTSRGVEVDYAAVRRQDEEAAAAQEQITKQDTPEEGSGRQPSLVCRFLRLPSLRSLPPCMPYPWSLPPLNGESLGLLVSLPTLTRKAFAALTQDPDAHAILIARSELRHVSNLQRALNADREVLAQEWRALGDARAALEVRRHDLKDDDFTFLQLELIRREQGAASRALDMRQRQARLRQARADITTSSMAQRDRLLAHWQGVPEAGGPVAPEELVLFEMESGRKGRPVEIQEQGEELGDTGARRWWRGWWWRR